MPAPDLLIRGGFGLVWLKTFQVTVDLITALDTAGFEELPHDFKVEVRILVRAEQSNPER